MARTGDEPVTQQELAVVVSRLEAISSHFEGAESPEDSAELRAQVEKAVKWASPWRQLVAFLAFMLVGAGSVYAAMRDYAREQVVDTVRDAHKADENPVEPSVQTVKQLQTDVTTVKTGVNTLVDEKKRRQEMESIELELEPHREQYQQQIQEWSTRKALHPNRTYTKPLKSDRHIELEAQLKKLTKE